MKLAIISPFQLRFARGIERFSWSLATALATQQHSVDILTWSWPDPVDWGQIPAGMQVRRVPHSRYYLERLAVPYYVAWLLRGRYDWVMVYFAGYGEVATLRLLRALRRQRVCTVVHFPYEAAPFAYSQFLHYGLVRNADQVVAVSNYVAHDVQIVLKQGCTVIGNGVDTQVFQPACEARATIRSRLGVTADTPIVMTVAALEQRKGVQWVIRALPHLLPRFPALQYWIIGEGDYRAALKNEIEQLGLQNQVRFLKRVDKVEDYLAAADISCLLSREEAFGIALLEAMAAALPVVASKRAPFDELVAQERGILVDETDVVAVTAALQTLLADPTRRTQMGRAGRDWVLHHHTWAHIAKQYTEVLTGRVCA